jgi:Uma2 family endonuclease
MTDTTTTPVKFTYEHYCLLPEEDHRELIEGDFYVRPAPSEEHQRICGNLYFHLRLFLRKNELGRVYIAPFDVILDEFSTVQPDLSFITQPRLSKIKREGLQGAPDLAVEVLSPKTRGRDEKLKRTLYFKHGVRELWLADPEDQSVSVFTRQESGLELWRLFPADTALESPLLVGFTVPLKEVFA